MTDEEDRKIVDAYLNRYKRAATVKAQIKQNKKRNDLIEARRNADEKRNEPKLTDTRNIITPQHYTTIIPSIRVQPTQPAIVLRSEQWINPHHYINPVNPVFQPQLQTLPRNPVFLPQRQIPPRNPVFQAPVNPVFKLPTTPPPVGSTFQPQTTGLQQRVPTVLSTTPRIGSQLQWHQYPTSGSSIGTDTNPL